jgi:RHS repeat-associated protein
LITEPDTYDYDAFGNKVNSTGTTPNNYLYRGEQYDPDLGLYYLRARYYNPATGRFMSRDPEEGKAKVPASLHKYLYANGDPVNMTDPKGRESMFETGIYVPVEVGMSAAAVKLGWCISAILDTIQMILNHDLNPWSAYMGGGGLWGACIAAP